MEEKTMYEFVVEQRKKADEYWAEHCSDYDSVIKDAIAVSACRGMREGNICIQGVEAANLIRKRLKELGCAVIDTHYNWSWGHIDFRF